MNPVGFSPKMLAFYPDGSGPVGLLLCESPEGARVTAIVEAGWLRLAGDATPEALAGLEVPGNARLPVTAKGWPEDWADGESALLDTIAEVLAGGTSWAELHESFPPAGTS
jgi:hypothetical protein